ncbi:uncharacterized protein LOC135845862 [Planococcus citri]|uniref:uncharacterized protein LOC135845862 n=1 Tax=Planococcus citri TaxID=170843 RepID=UPI0031F8139E
MDFTCVTTLPVENNPNSFYKVKVECSGKSISMIVFDNNTAYKGEISSSYISDQSNLLNLSEKEYIEELRKAFLTSSSEFSYSIAEDNFYLKKSIQTNSANSIKIKFTSIKLDKVDFQTSILAVLDATLNENNQYVKKIDELQSLNEALMKGNESLLEQMKRFQADKNNMESILYYRFLNLLNSKKKKINELKGKLGVKMDEDTASEFEEEMELNDEGVENVYDADTDLDEEIEKQVETAKDECLRKPVEETKQKEESKKFQKLGENSKGNSGSSKPMSIFDRLSILDPTIPFDP